MSRDLKSLITRDNFAVGISVVSFILAGLSYCNTRFLSHQHVSPEIKCKLEYPLKVEKRAVQKQIDNPEIIITNTGPIKVVALATDFKSYTYDKNLGVIESYSELKQEPYGHLIFSKELHPSDHIKKQLHGVHTKDKVAIYAFALKYYRENDMKMFRQEDMFFIDNYEIFSHKDYLKNDKYHKIIQAIESYKPTSDERFVNLLAVDNSTWLVKETSQTGIFILKGDGKSLIMASASEDPHTLIKNNALNKNRPFLFVRPSKFRKTGAYFKPEIMNDETVEIEISYEVGNIGDMEAINISEGGGTSYNKSLKPGEKIYFKPKIDLMKKGDQSPHDLINNLVKKDYALESRQTIIYFQKSENKEYMTRVTYRIGKDKVQLVKYEIK